MAYLVRRYTSATNADLVPVLGVIIATKHTADEHGGNDGCGGGTPFDCQTEHARDAAPTSLEVDPCRE